jgi:hypothetical protein
MTALKKCFSDFLRSFHVKKTLSYYSRYSVELQIEFFKTIALYALGCSLAKFIDTFQLFLSSANKSAATELICPNDAPAPRNHVAAGRRLV